MKNKNGSGCIDTVGGEILSSVISEIKYNGIIASTGLASSHLLHTTVYPFILRNITLWPELIVFTPIKVKELKHGN